MKRFKYIFRTLIVAMLAIILGACSGGGSGSDSATTSDEKTTEEINEIVEGNGLESTKIRWGRGNSGNILVTLAKEKGFFADEGIEEVEEVNMQLGSDALAVLSAGDVDILSNFGTDGPLKYIAAGEDLTIWGGFMMEGAMPIIAKKGTEWNDVEDILGKKVAGNPGSSSGAVAGPLLEAGHTPADDVEWVNIESDADKLAAVSTGEVDYAIMGTDQNYALSQMPEVEVMAYTNDVTPNYSCCRMESRTDWLDANPNTARAVMRAMIRAQEYYEDHKEESVDIMAEQLNADKEYVEAYMLNENYNLHLDPLENQVHRIWGWIGEMNFLADGWEDIDLSNHMNTEIYQDALNDLSDKYSEENPEFYEGMQKFFAEQNGNPQ